jgi:hypothetical protein
MPPLSQTRRECEQQWEREHPDLDGRGKLFWLVGAMDARCLALEKQLAELRQERGKELIESVGDVPFGDD